MTQRPRLTIGRMNVHLPASLNARADAIAREAAMHLSRLPLGFSAHLDRLPVSPLTVSPAESNTVIAMRIAQAIHAELQAGVGAGIGLPVTGG